MSPQRVGLRTGAHPGHLVLAKVLLTPDALNPLQQQQRKYIIINLHVYLHNNKTIEYLKEVL